MMIAGYTGWAERWILWYLPFPRALQYRHYILAHHGEWTVRPGTGGGGGGHRDTDEMAAEFARLRSVAGVYRERVADEADEWDGSDGSDGSDGADVSDVDDIDFGYFVDDGD